MPNYELLQKIRLLACDLSNAESNTMRSVALCRMLTRLFDQVVELEDLEYADAVAFDHIRDCFQSLGDSADKSVLFDLPNIIERSLKKSVPEYESRFPTILDSDFRNILDRDLIDVQISLQRGLWKSAMVMCGSILEASMYEFLLRNPLWTMDPSRSSLPKYKGNIRDIKINDFENQWTLNHLIEFFCDNKLLDGDPEKWRTTLHFFIREYRNLVHPMAEMRKKANQGVTAEAAQQCYANLIAVLKVLDNVPTPK